MKCCIRKSIVLVCSIIVISCILSGCGNKSIKVSATNTAMGTVVQHTLYVSDESVGEAVVAEIQKELEERKKRMKVVGRGKEKDRKEI